MRKIYICVSILLLLMVAGCGPAESGSPRSSPQEPQPPTTPMPPLSQVSEGLRLCLSPMNMPLNAYTGENIPLPSVAAAPYSSTGLQQADFAAANLTMQFNNSIALNDADGDGEVDGFFHLTPLNPPAPAIANLPNLNWRFFFSDSINIGNLTNDLIVADDRIEIPSLDAAVFRLREINRLSDPMLMDRSLSAAVLRWDTPYAICNYGALIDTNGQALSPYLGSWMSPPAPPVLGFRKRREGNVTPIYDQDTILNATISSSPGITVDDYQARIRSGDWYNFTAADLLLTGDNISIAIFDTGILQGTNASDAVVFRALDLPNILLPQNAIHNPARPQTIANHGTNMARYLLNFAPGAALYDFPFATEENHLGEQITMALAERAIMREEEDRLLSGIDLADYVRLTNATNLNISIFSHSGGVDLNTERLDAIADAVNNGLVYVKSVGNIIDERTDMPVPNNIADKFCVRDQLFVPYMRDLSNAKGAYVVVNSNENRMNNPGRYRAAAGDAANYTITLFENGFGATSEATATFSAMLALMMEANEIYNDSSFTPRQLVEIMFDTAVPSANRTQFGQGFLDMGAALEQLRNRTPANYDLYAEVSRDPRFLNLSALGFNLTNDEDECSTINPSP